VEADLRELFLKFGDLLSVHVKRNERHNKLYAFILYKEPEQAAEAL
jgi:RNA recognition motif-containing protein